MTLLVQPTRKQNHRKNKRLMTIKQKKTKKKKLIRKKQIDKKNLENKQMKNSKNLINHLLYLMIRLKASPMP